MFTQSSKSADTQPKTTTEPTKPTPTRPSGEPSIISADLRVVGDLHCSGELQVKGNVEGDIRSRSVTIGEGAHVQGSVMADQVHVAGSIQGQVEAPAVTVARSARVMGDIIHQTLAVEAGAFLDGHCRHLDSKAAGGVQPLKAAKTEAPVPEKKAATGS